MKELLYVLQYLNCILACCPTGASPGSAERVQEEESKVEGGYRRAEERDDAAGASVRTLPVSFRLFYIALFSSLPIVHS